ncbi:RNA-binding protein 1 [Parasteatoda tepidariorum]|uniref:RNA-binding protein 1 n=1 Tax=Parasteatoda tepidariorum TaxID=114398 RepID=UPI00077F9BEB|nr:RNA-binding protein 1 [Parasteatoda tepidariorum]XP_015927236.1 RNA-binding protein 1 [Parasteatoda tepidariorum]
MSARRFSDWNLECKVYIGNISNRTTKVDIEEVFSKYGPLRNVWIARSPPGFAFVEYEDRRDAEEACACLDGSRLCSSRIRVEMSHGKTKRRREGGGRRSPRPRYYSRSRSRSRSPRYNQRDKRDRSYSRERR